MTVRSTSAFFLTALLLSSALVLLPTSPASRAASPETITTFADGSSSVTLTFAAPGNNNGTSIRLPQRAQLSGATMDLTGSEEVLTSSLSFTSAADFATGTLVGLNASTDALMLNESSRERTLVRQPAYATGSSPGRIDSGDVTGDALQDIVVPNRGGNTIGVFAQLANGTFGAMQTIAVGTAPVSVVLGDLDRDGDLDAVVVNSGSGTITILFQGPAGLGGAVTRTTGTGAGSTPMDAAIGNFDAANGNDIAVTNSADRTVSLFAQQAVAGTFPVSGSTLTLPLGTEVPGGIFAGDLNNDTLTDLVALSISPIGGGVFRGNADVFLQSGGSLGAATQIIVGGLPFDGVVGDVSGDVAKDVALSEVIMSIAGTPSGAKQVEWFKNVNGATWGAGVPRTAQLGALGIDIGDIDDDGKNDIVAADSRATGAAGGILAAVDAGFLGSYAQSGGALGLELPYAASANGSMGATVGDFDNDGSADGAISTNAGNTLEVFLQRDLIHYRILGNWTSPVTGTAWPVTAVNASWGSTPNGQTVTVEASNDGGATWTTLASGVRQTFTIGGKQIRLRVTLSTIDDLMSPSLQDISAVFESAVLPKDVTITVGNSASASYALLGNLTADTANVKDALQAETTAGVPDANGNVTIPLTVETVSPGRITLGNLNITFIRNAAPSTPVLLAPTPDAWTGPTPVYRVSSTDPDTNASLTFTIQLSRNASFVPLVDTYGPSDAGWSMTAYASGDEAVFVPSRALSGGRFYWRAQVADADGGRSAWSAAQNFSVDTTRPEGTVIDDGDTLAIRTQIHAVLNFSDAPPDTGIVGYEYWIGTTPGGSATVPPTNTTQRDVTVTGLDLVDGTYYWTARARNGAGLWSEPASSDGIDVVTSICVGGTCNLLPVVAITSPTDGSRVNGTVFIAGTGRDPDSTVLTVQVRIDDGPWKNATGTRAWTLAWDTRTVTNENHTISARGIDGMGASSSPVAIMVAVRNDHALALISSRPQTNSTMLENSSADFSVVAFDNAGHTLTYAWTTNGTAISGATSATYTLIADFTSQGTRNLTVAIADGHGLTVAVSWNVKILNVNRPPVAVIDSPQTKKQFASGDKVTFTSAGSLDPDNDLLKYTWSFGDGRSADGASATHTYSQGGTYNVVLSVSDGQSTSRTTIVVIVTPGAGEALGGMGWLMLVLLLVVASVGFLGYVLMSRKRRAAKAAEKLRELKEQHERQREEAANAPAKDVLKDLKVERRK